MKKAIIAVVLFLLVLSIAYSLVDLRPDIEITFSELVEESTININLTNQSGVLFDLDLITSDNPTFVYKPAEDLKEGFYTVRAQAEDLFGILGEVIEVSFLLQISPLDVNITKPRLGVTPTHVLNLTLKTDRDAVCNYSFIGFEELYEFDSTGSLEHDKEEISIADTTYLYIQCLDGYGKVYQEIKQLFLDLNNPSISVYAEDVTEPPLETTLNVNSNEEVICRFDNDSTVFGGMQEFDNYDEMDEDAYELNPQQVLDGEHLTDGKPHTFFVMCRDKAGRLSNAASATFNVDTEQPAAVTIHYPTGQLSSSLLWFNVSTNKVADYCQYTNRSDKTGYITFSVQGKTHISSGLDLLHDGAYTYHVRCRFHDESIGTWYVEASTNCVIDNTKPQLPYVNMDPPAALKDLNITDRTYKDYQLCGEWEGEDNQSSISQYAYYAYWDRSTDIMIGKDVTSGTSDCIDLDLNDSEKYYFKVSARNSVGLWSDNMSSSPITVDVSLTPKGCDNGLKDGDETDEDCGGSCDSCSNGMNCIINSDCDSRYCNSSNKCAKPRCDDGIRNGAETSTDCGGNCDKCSVGKTCNENRDCKSNNCDKSTGKCEEMLDKCENNELDPGETDEDCGGDCPACGIGKSCDFDSDCIEGAKCEEGACLLDSDGDGIVDSKDNCPDLANEEQADVDGDDLGDMCDPDSDNDELPDSFEQQYFECVTCANPNDDPDKDGLMNKEEYTYNTNPMRKDTDEDGYADREEIDKGTDPLDPRSHPGGGFLKSMVILSIVAALGGGGYFAYTKLVVKGKPFIPPRAPAARGAVRKEIRRPVALKGPVPKPPLKPEQPPLKRPMPRAPMKKPVAPATMKTVRPAPMLKKPAIGRDLGAEPKIRNKVKAKEEGNIFSRLSEIAEKDKVKQIEKKMEFSHLSDKELNDRIRNLKKELKVK
ncbi:hypothetical protein KY366_02830 [Candidatus Woesearchaeota archaeon]|nr:hypothetical protein [Candidatus Woesearchaeota archaeon]